LDTCLWWAGKELVGDKCLSDYVGKNEKTKIVVKIQKVFLKAFNLRKELDHQRGKHQSAKLSKRI
jgi:cilia- and flagella-associated protein 298